MDLIKTPIIPVKPQYIGEEDEIDYKAICFFAATNFFLGSDTHYKGKKYLQSGRIYKIERNSIIDETKWFDWSYNPAEITFDTVVDEFSHLFEDITSNQTKGKRIILPLSGGLDSRSQAAALIGRDNVFTYSYEYPNGIKETEIAGKVADVAGFEFEKYLIPRGYLWNKIDKVAELIDYSGDLTSPRQASITDNLLGKGDILYLGHWGDVLFDDMGVQEEMSEDHLVDFLKKKILKKGGIELANALWKVWGLSGSFEDEFNEKLSSLLADIKINNRNAKIRAFKSLYWAPRWTSVYLSVFSDVLPLSLPYYDDRMCEFITKVPERYLSSRKIQIEYIKRKSPLMAKVPWQPFYPYNLYDFGRHTSNRNLLRRGYNKMIRILKNREIIERNWELQFLGGNNDKNLKGQLFENEKFDRLIPTDLVKMFYDDFIAADSFLKVHKAHQISTLLSLSVFAKHKL